MDFVSEKSTSRDNKYHILKRPVDPIDRWRQPLMGIARAEDLRACIALALTSHGSLANAQSAELMASDRRRAPNRAPARGFVVVRRPPAQGPAALGRGFEG